MQKLTEHISETEHHCKHHWIIDSPAGPTSKGFCRFCGEARLFNNFTGSDYGYDKSTLDQIFHQRKGLQLAGLPKNPREDEGT